MNAPRALVSCVPTGVSIHQAATSVPVLNMAIQGLQMDELAEVSDLIPPSNTRRLILHRSASLSSSLKFILEIAQHPFTITRVCSESLLIKIIGSLTVELLHTL